MLGFLEYVSKAVHYAFRIEDSLRELDPALSISSPYLHDLEGDTEFRVYSIVIVGRCVIK